MVPKINLDKSCITFNGTRGEIYLYDSLIYNDQTGRCLFFSFQN